MLISISLTKLNMLGGDFTFNFWGSLAFFFNMLFSCHRRPQKLPLVILEQVWVWNNRRGQSPHCCSNAHSTCQYALSPCLLLLMAWEERETKLVLMGLGLRKQASGVLIS